MKSPILLTFLLLTSFTASAAEVASPELLQLEKLLTTEQEARQQNVVSPEQYLIFLSDFRPKLQTALAEAPPSPENTATHARILVLLGENAEAIAGLDRALEARPGNTTLTISLGQARLQNKDYVGALAAADEVLTADPKNFDALALKHQSAGRATPSVGGGPSTTATPATDISGREPQGVFTEPKTRNPVVIDVPGVPQQSSAPIEDQPAPLWPLAVPLGIGLIGYGVYRNQRTGPDELTPPEVDRGGRTTWGANEPLDNPAELSPEKIAENRRNLKFAAIAGGMILGGIAITKFGPIAISGAEAFFTSVGPASTGLTPAFAGGGGGPAAAALNPTTITVGAKTAGVAAAVVANTKVASDYFSYARSESAAGGSPERKQAHGRYEGSPKHGGAQRGGPRGKISPEPRDGQAALDNSVQAKPTSSSRVGVDVNNEQIVVLREHLPGRFHGYVNSWDELESFAKNALIRAGKTNSRGRIIKP